MITGAFWRPAWRVCIRSGPAIPGSKDLSKCLFAEAQGPLVGS